MTETDIVAAEVVKIVSGFYEDFRETMQTVTRLEAVLFFPTMSYGNQAYMQPIVMPAHLANRMNDEIAAVALLSENDLAEYIEKVFRMMQCNSVIPAPISFHCQMLEMFERIAINGMQDKPDTLVQLSKLKIGDLVLLQFDIKEQELTTGLRVVPNALTVHEQNLLTTVPTSILVH